MRNFVAKNDFNRASTHKSLKDYTRVDSKSLALEGQDSLDELLWEEECRWMESFEDQWEVTNTKTIGNSLQENIMFEPFVTLDIETLGTPKECGTSFIAMPSAAFVLWKGWDTDPEVLYGEFNVQAQLNRGAKVNSRTVGFWMQEAIRGNSAAVTIARILNESVSNDSELFESLAFSLEKNWNAGDLTFYGNGPEFDLSIYEAVSANVEPHVPTPWKFNKTASARNLKEMYRTAGQDYKSLETLSYTKAAQYMHKLGWVEESIDITADKHNPIFDALAEAVTIASVRDYLLNS